MDFPTSLDFFPAELVIWIGEFLDRKTLAAFIRTSKRYAQLLTPQLLTLWLSCKTGKYCFTRNWPETQHWTSSHIVDFFQNFPSDVSQIYCCSTLLFRFADGGNLELVKLMLSRGADLEAKGANGETPLHIATSGGHIQVVQALLEAGADASAKDRYGDTLLQRAASMGKPTMIRYLISSGQYTLEALLEAFERGMKCFFPKVCAEVCAEVWPALENAGYKFNATGTDGQIYLHFAAKRGLSFLVQFFLDRGHDPFRLDGKGNTALSIACSEVFSRSEDMLETPKLLINAMQAAGGDPFKANREGVTPLHKAIQNSQVDLVRLFLDSGASVTARGKNGIKCMEKALRGPRDMFELLVDREPALWPTHMLQSSLHGYTVELKKGRGYQDTPKAIARILKLAKSGKAAINVSTRDSSGSTPLHNTCLARHNSAEIPGLIRSFIEAGADIDMPDDEGRTPLHNILRVSTPKSEREIIQTMINLSKNINKLSKAGDSYLHLAADANQLRAVQLLLSKMSKDTVFAANESGYTSLHYAAISENTSIIQQILATGIDVNAKDRHGRTALHYIDNKHNESCVAVLIEAGADVNILDNEGRPPIHHASIWGKDGMMELYVKGGASEHEGCDSCNRYIKSTREWLKEVGC
ncbi:hypothetical protein AnigIFM60653_005377 [Aspergillus niger]|nr:hypothetical protein AnigIFM50267_003456 [Aspergillus niger]GKZ99625.1 hypothetical protein AnigIFM60653_005377 [Aspergillus niger]GLA35401.1 hypothetical protein AnigIFM63309_010807 [Aspergillus niger]